MDDGSPLRLGRRDLRTATGSAAGRAWALYGLLSGLAGIGAAVLAILEGFRWEHAALLGSGVFTAGVGLWGLAWKIKARSIHAQLREAVRKLGEAHQRIDAEPPVTRESAHADAREASRALARLLFVSEAHVTYDEDRPPNLLHEAARLVPLVEAAWGESAVPDYWNAIRQAGGSYTEAESRVRQMLLARTMHDAVPTFRLTKDLIAQYGLYEEPGQ